MERYNLETPEALSVTYDVAGIGSRFMAALIDVILQLFLLGAVVLLVILIEHVGLFHLGDSLAAIVFTTASFLILWAYYPLFEWLWAGRTPGKRVVRIRVVDAAATPIGFTQSLIRNLIRFVDFLPSLYGIGIVSMFASGTSRRLGDFAAGTVVVKERSVKLDGVPAEAPAKPHAAPMLRAGEVDPEEENWALRALTAADVSVMEEFLDRAAGIPTPVRVRIASEIAERVRRRIGAREPLDPVAFVERVMLLTRTRTD